MAISPEPPDPFLWKATGSAIGSVVSLVYLKPLNIRDLISRLLVSGIAGYLGGFAVLEYFNWPAIPTRWVTASAIVALFSWFIIGAGIRILQGMDKLPK